MYLLLYFLENFKDSNNNNLIEYQNQTIEKQILKKLRYNYYYYNNDHFFNYKKQNIFINHSKSNLDETFNYFKINHSKDSLLKYNNISTYNDNSLFKQNKISQDTLIQNKLLLNSLLIKEKVITFFIY